MTLTVTFNHRGDKPKTLPRELELAARGGVVPGVCGGGGWGGVKAAHMPDCPRIA